MQVGLLFGAAYRRPRPCWVRGYTCFALQTDSAVHGADPIASLQVCAAGCVLPYFRVLLCPWQPEISSDVTGVNGSIVPAGLTMVEVMVGLAVSCPTRVLLLPYMCILVCLCFT